MSDCHAGADAIVVRCMSQRKPLLTRPIHCEALEGRRLLAGEPWGAVPHLIRQDAAAAQFPAVTGKGQTVAIIDTGIDYNLPYLGGGFGAGYKVVGGWDFVEDDADPMDTFGHGTNVSGIVAASPFVMDGMKYSGIAPEANLVALRVDAADDPVPPATT